MNLRSIINHDPRLFKNIDKKPETIQIGLSLGIEPGFPLTTFFLMLNVGAKLKFRVTKVVVPNRLRSTFTRSDVGHKMI